MKPKFLRVAVASCGKPVPALIAFVMSIQPLMAVDYQWDPNGVTAGLGGTGSWDNTSLFWDVVGTAPDDGTGTTVNIADINPATAVDTVRFGGTAGTITLNASNRVTSTTFNTGGYILNLTNTATTHNFGTVTATAANAATMNTTLGTGTTTLVFGTGNNFSAFNGTLNVGVSQAAGAGKLGVQMTSGGFGAGMAINVTSNSTIFVSGNTAHSAPITLLGGDTGESLGQLRMDTGTWSGNVVLAGTITGTNDGFVGGSTGTGTITGVISETGGSRELSKAGGATTVLTNVNTYTGGTRIRGGTLGFSSGSLGTTGTITMNGGTLMWNGGNTLDVSGRIALTGSSNAGFNTNGNDVTLANALGGSTTGSVTKSGGGTLTLTGFLNLTGTTGSCGVSISGGILSVSNIADSGTTSQIGNTTGSGDPYLALNGGTLRYSGIPNVTTARKLWIDTGAGTIDIVNAATSLSFTNTAGNLTNRVTKNGAGTLNFVDAITGAAGGITINAGTFNLTGISTYTGATNVNGGLLAFNGAAGATTGVSATSIAGGGILRLDNSTASIADRFGAGAITLFGGSIEYVHNGAAATSYAETLGSLTVAGGNSTIATSQAEAGQTSKLTFASLARTGGTVNFTGNGLGATVDPRNEISFTTAPTLTGGIIGSWATINGTELATLSGNSLVTYSGYTDVDARGPSTIADGANSNVRILGDGTSGNIGLGGGTTTINSLLMANANFAATVDTAGKTLVTEGVVLGSGAQALSLGVAANDGSLMANSAGGLLTLNNQSATNPLTVNAAIVNNTSASSLIKTGPGLVTLTGSNSFTGSVQITQGMLSIDTLANGGLNSGLGASSNSTDNVAISNATLRYTGNTVTSNRGLRITTGAAAVVDVANAGQALTLSGGIATTTGNFIKAGAGTLVLSGTTGLTGTMSVNAGTLSLTGGVLNITNWSVGSGATLEMGGTNIMVANHDTALSPTREIVVNGGTLSFLSSAVFRFGNVTLNNGAVWTSAAGLAAYDVLLGNTTSGAATVKVTGTGTATMTGTGIHLQGVQNFDVAEVTGNASTDLQVNMVLASQGSTGGAAGGINKLGAGTMTLSAVNTFTGAINLQSGVLQLDGVGSLQSGNYAGAVTNNATFQSSSSATQTMSGVISGAGSLIKDGIGTLTLSGANTYSGDTTVTGGRLNLASTNASSVSVTGATLGGEGSTTGGLTFHTGAALTVNPNTAGFLSSSGAVSMTGSTTLLLDAVPTLGVGTLTVDVIGYGSLTGFENLVFDPAGYRTSLVNDTANSKIKLLIEGAVRTWNRITPGVWDVQTSTSWAEGDHLFSNGDTVVFNASSTVGTVQLEGELKPVSVTVDNLSGTAPDYTFTGTGYISGAATLTKSNTGLLTIATPNVYTGATTLNAGRLRLTNVLALGNSSGITLNGGSLEFATDTTAGSKAVTMGGSTTIVLDRETSGAGFTTTMSSLNTSGGNYTLTVNKGSNVTDSSILLFNGQFNGEARTTTFSIGAGATLQHTGTMPTGARTVSLVKSGAGTLILGDYGNWDGGAATQLNGGTLELRGVMGDSGVFRNLVASAGTTLRLARDTNSPHYSGLTAAAGMNLEVGRITEASTSMSHTMGSLSFGGTLNVNRASTITDVATGTVGFTGATTLTSNATVNTGVNSQLSLNGAVGGAFSILKTGTGTLLLAASNTYSGGTTVSQGTVLFSNANSLGTTGNITLGDANTGANPVALLANAAAGLARPIGVSSSGTGMVTIGSVNSALTGQTFTGTLTMGRDVTLQAGTSDRTTFSGLITGTGNVTVTSPFATDRRVVFDRGSANPANDFVGDVLIGDGAYLQIGVATATNNKNLPDASTVSLGTGSRLRFATTGSADVETIGTLVSTAVGSGLVEVQAGTGFTLTVGGDSESGNFSGVIQDGSGTMNLVKTGTGTQTLSGINTYTGNTVVNSGSLTLANQGRLTFRITNASSNTLTGAGTVVLNGDFTFDTSAVTATTGTWVVENAPSLSGAYGSTFRVVNANGSSWTDLGGNKWSKVDGTQLWTFDETSGTLTLAQSGYDSWALQIPNAADRDRTDDPDGDGFTNLQEFLYGTSPNTGNGALVRTERSGGNLVIRWLQRETGATYVLKESTTLETASWTTSGISPALDDQTGVATDYDRYMATIPLDSVKKFFRVVGTEN